MALGSGFVQEEFTGRGIQALVLNYSLGKLRSSSFLLQRLQNSIDINEFELFKSFFPQSFPDLFTLLRVIQRRITDK